MTEWRIRNGGTESGIKRGMRDKGRNRGIKRGIGG